jgi:ubiquitin-conjugating enzyme E2 D
MPSAYLCRLKKELKNLKKNPVCNCDAQPEDNSLMEWLATILGPDGTPYANGVFKLKLKFSSSYPYEAPQVRFITKVFHPNIDSSGGICLDILKEKWSPILDIEKILLSICSLLSDPNPKDPLVKYAADLYMNNREAFNNEAKSWTAIYANPL